MSILCFYYQFFIRNFFVCEYHEIIQVTVFCFIGALLFEIEQIAELLLAMDTILDIPFRILFFDISSFFYGI
uniref:Uncharacterized protein n=1 Tax=Rhizophora mucronata TaxID=61149 RepID=A0A2P2QW08_RHIMU